MKLGITSGDFFGMVLTLFAGGILLGGFILGFGVITVPDITFQALDTLHAQITILDWVKYFLGCVVAVIAILGMIKILG